MRLVVWGGQGHFDGALLCPTTEAKSAASKSPSCLLERRRTWDGPNVFCARQARLPLCLDLCVLLGGQACQRAKPKEKEEEEEKERKKGDNELSRVWLQELPEPWLPREQAATQRLDLRQICMLWAWA